jgi:hypothetical protein
MGAVLLFSVLAVLFMGLAIAVYVLFRAHRELKRGYAALNERVERQRKDLIGLCSAAVQVDRRLLEQDRRMREYTEKVESISTQDTSHQPYYTAIDKVKKGASPQELVAEYGLSMSEANLLVNLYSQKGK